MGEAKKWEFGIGVCAPDQKSYPKKKKSGGCEEGSEAAYWQA